MRKLHTSLLLFGLIIYAQAHSLGEVFAYGTPNINDMKVCKHLKDDTYLVAADNLALFDLKPNGDETELSVGGLTEIYDLHIIDEEKALVAGDNGMELRSITSVSVIETFSHATTDPIRSISIIHGTIYFVECPMNQEEILVHDIGDLSTIRKGNPERTDIIATYHRINTPKVHIGGTNNWNITSVDYTNLERVHLITLNAIEEVYQIISGRSTETILVSGSPDFISEIDDIKQESIHDHKVSETNIRRIELIADSQFLIYSNDDGIDVIDLDSGDSVEIFDDHETYHFCFNYKTSMFGISQSGFTVYALASTSSCIDPNCKQCGFKNDFCLICINGKKAQSGQCVDSCKTGWYYDEKINTCLLDRVCTEGKVLNPEEGTCECPEGTIYSEKFARCGTCQEFNLNCLSCKEGTLECQNCATYHFLNDKKECERMKCKDANPSCSDCDELTYECREYRCESAGCTRCPKDPKICEEDFYADSKDLVKPIHSIINAIQKIGVPIFQLLGVVLDLIKPQFGTPLITASLRISYYYMILLVNNNNGEIFRAFMTNEDPETRNSNEENMVSVGNSFFIYNISINPNFVVYIKIVVLGLVSILFLITIIKPELLLKSQGGAKVLNIIRRFMVSANLTCVNDFSLYLAFAFSNLDTGQGGGNFVVVCLSILFILIHSIYQVLYLIRYIVNMKEPHLPIKYTPEEIKKIEEEKQKEIEGDEEEIEKLEEKQKQGLNLDDEENKNSLKDKQPAKQEQGLNLDDEENKQSVKPKKAKESPENEIKFGIDSDEKKIEAPNGDPEAAPNGNLDDGFTTPVNQENQNVENEEENNEDDGKQVDIEKTKELIYKNDQGIDNFINTCLMNKNGFDYSKYFVLFGILRFYFVLLLIATLPQFSKVTFYTSIVIEIMFLNYSIKILKNYWSLKLLPYSQVVASSLLSLISTILLLNLNTTDKKQTSPQAALIWICIFGIFLEIVLTLINIIFTLMEGRVINTEEESKRLKGYVFILKVFFYFNF